MTGYKRFATRLLVTTAVLGWTPSAALAQSAPGGIAEPDVILDDNGVDLLTGKYYAVAAEARSQDLAFQAKWFGAYDASLLNSRVVISGSEVFVSVAGKTVKFTKVGSTYVADDNKGGTLERTSHPGFIYRNKAGDAATFEDDPANLAGNAAGTTSARLIQLTFAEPTSRPILLSYKSVSSGGLVYQRVSLIAQAYEGWAEGYNTIKPSYVSDVATHADFRKLASAKAFYQGPYVTQQDCWSGYDSCPAVVAREQLTISTSTAGGIDTISMTDKGGDVTVVKKGANGVTAIRNPGDAVDGVTIAYNGSGEVSTLTSYGRSFTYAFGTSGANRTATVTLSGGGSKYYVLDPARRILLSRRNEEMETESFAYDGEDRVTQITYPEGNAVTFAYDGRANPTQTSRVAKPGSGDVTTSITMGFPTGCTNATPTCNQATWTQDAKGVQTDYVNGTIEDEYYVDEVRHPAATVGGDRLVVRNRYSNIYGRILDGSNFEEPTTVVKTELTQVVRMKALLGNFSSMAWLGNTNYMFDDNFGLHEILPHYMTRTAPSPPWSSDLLYGRDRSNYDALGRLTKSEHLGFGFSADQYFYDVKNRLTGAIGPDQDGAGTMLFPAKRITYNSRGLVEKVETGTATAQTQVALNAMTVLRAVEHSYDTNRRLEKSLVRAGGNIIAVTQYSYNAQGLLECAAQRMNPAIFASLPAWACTLGTAGSFGPDRITKNHYDAAGRLLRTEHGLGTAEVEDEVTYSYNDNGTVATLTDAKGNRTSYEYDGHDRLKKAIFPHKTSIGTSDPADYEQYWYDANDNITQRRLRDGQSMYFTYDRLNRVTLVDLPGSESDISYTYDVEGRLKTATRGTATNSLSYDGFGRLTSEGSNVGAMQFEYDSLSRVTRMTWPDGFYVTYEYNGVGPVKTIKENGSATIASYGYDSFGRQILVTYGNGAAQSYGFDSATRLSSIGHDLSGTANDLTIGLTYNPAGQIATRTGSNDAFAWTGHFNVDRPYTSNGLNQFVTAGAVGFVHDARGNLTTSGTSSYGYSSENLMISGPGGATLGYDGRGKLFETAKAGVTTRFLYAGSALVGEYSAGNVLQRRFIHGPRVDNPLLWYEGTGTTDKRYLLSDERGSITTLSNGSAALFGINRYDEYGIPGTGNVGRFGYTGQTWLPEIGMNYYKARIYSPTLGRFMQTDPIGYGDGTNMYNYVGSDPVNGTDPTGMTEIVGTEDITVTGSRSAPDPVNCLSFGGGCYSTGRDIADELAYAYAERNERLKTPPAAKGANPCPTPPAKRPIGTTGVYEAALWDPKAMAMAAEVRNLAHAATRERYGRSGTDDESDAYRHFYGSVGLTNLVGERRAQGILNANEVTNGKAQAAIDMDTYNNWVGVAMAKDPKFDGWSTADMAEYALKNGCLQLKP